MTEIPEGTAPSAPGTAPSWSGYPAFPQSSGDARPAAYGPGQPGFAPAQGYPPQGYPPQGYPGYGYQPYPAAPTRMPGSVRAAQVLSWIFAAAGIAITVALGILGGAESAGAAMFGFLFPIVLGGLAFGFGSAGSSTRTTAQVVAGICCVISFGTMGEVTRPGPHPPGVLGLVLGIAILVTLSRRSAAQWFGRRASAPYPYPPAPHGPGTPQG